MPRQLCGGLSTGNAVAVIFTVALGASAAFMSFRAWDVFMLWFIVDGMALSSWVEMLRKRVGDLAGDGDVS